MSSVQAVKGWHLQSRVVLCMTEQKHCNYVAEELTEIQNSQLSRTFHVVLISHHHANVTISDSIGTQTILYYDHIILHAGEPLNLWEHPDSEVHWVDF